MSWRMVEIECYGCRTIIGWSWADWTDDPLLANDPTSTLCDDCRNRLYPNMMKTTEKGLKTAPEEGTTDS